MLFTGHLRLMHGLRCILPAEHLAGADVSDGTSPVQQTRKRQQRSTSYARKKRDLLNFGVRLLTGEAINVFGGAFYATTNQHELDYSKNSAPIAQPERGPCQPLFA